MPKNNNITIYFSHGKESGPYGNKINYLSKIAISKGFKVESIDYTQMLNPDERVRILLESVEKNNSEILFYGSSMGAYVSLVASRFVKPKRLFLCAPALYLPGYEVQNFDYLNCPITIIQGRKDLIVNPLTTINFAKKYKCKLHLTDDDHSLSGSEKIISKVFAEFIKI